MKRLLLISLIGFMLIGQAHASELITRENVAAISKGAGLALLPLIARGACVIAECTKAERADINHCKENLKRNKPGTWGCAYDRDFKTPSNLYYLFPKANIINRLLTCYGPNHKRYDSITSKLAHNPAKIAPVIHTLVTAFRPDEELERSKFDNTDTSYLYNADKHRIFWNRFAAFLSSVLFCASAAKLSNLNLPAWTNYITSSDKYTHMGIAAGSTLSLALLLPYLQVPEKYI